MEHVWEDVLNYYEVNHASCDIAFGLLAMMLYVWWACLYKKDDWVKYIPRGYNRGKTRMRNERRTFVLNMAAHDFVDSVEERVGQNEFSRDEATEVYRLLKQVLPLRTLFPSVDPLKAKIKARLGKHITPNFPDKAKKVRPKNLFDPTPKRVVL